MVYHRKPPERTPNVPPQRKQGNRKKERVTLSAQLVVGEDNDLIDWFRDIRGSRNQVIKNTLRAGLELPLVNYAAEDDTPSSNGTATTGDLEQMRAEFAQWTERVIADLPDYVRGLVRESLNGQAPEQPTIEAAPALAEDEIDKRVGKMKKAKW